MVSRSRTWPWSGLLTGMAIVLSWTFSDALPSRAQPVSASMEDATHQLRATINLLGYDPYWIGRPQTRFRLSQFADIKEAGFTAVRINLFGFDHMDADNKLDPAWLQRVDTVTKAALAQNLAVILDEHDHVPCRKDALACGPKLQAFWTQMAPYFAKAPSNVFFEIMNEPGGPWTPAIWNTQMRMALKTIRESNPDRPVVVGPACSNDFKCLPQLQLPDGDRNLIVTFHYYEPLTFTHQGISWNAQYAKLANVKWGSKADKDQISTNFDTVADWAKANGRPILLGEFGAIDGAPGTARTAYVAKVARAAEARHFAWAFWQFEMNFALYDMKSGQWDKPMLKALFPGRSVDTNFPTQRARQ